MMPIRLASTTPAATGWRGGTRDPYRNRGTGMG